MSTLKERDRDRDRDREIDTHTHTHTHTEQGRQRMEIHTQAMAKSSHIKYSGSPGEKQEGRTGEMLEKIMTGCFPKLTEEDINPLIMDAL